MDLLKTLTDLLLKNNLKIATAESCTAGGLAFELTKLAGSSAYFERGFVTYSNEAKIELLGVPAETIEIYGAVSSETAKAMAEGALKNSHADVALSVTGIAGPDGGSTEKPVGTAWFGFVRKGAETKTMLKQFNGDRDAVRRAAIDFLMAFISSEVE